MKLSVAIFFLAMAQLACSQEIDTLQIAPESHLSVGGRSNINTFSCLYTSTFSDSSLLVRKSKGSWQFHSEGLIFQTLEFDCDHDRMTRDFHETMKADQFPEMKMSLSKLDFKEDSVNLDLSLQVVGNTKKYSIDVSGSRESESGLVIRGIKILKMSDFGLQPPTALWGMVRVYDEIIIDFYIKLTNK